MTNIKEHSEFHNTIVATTILCMVFAVASLSVLFFAPEGQGFVSQTEIAIIEEPQTPEERAFEEEVLARAENVAWISEKDLFNKFKIETSETTDKSLEFYRNPSTRAAVEWFYLRVTGNRDVTMAILAAADREDIPLSLAFALCYAESRYNRYARNLNTNGTIDRGLFQLNDRSFPRLENEDFYNPEISAKHGMQHLRYCINVAGNETTAVAMYNAGITRVRNDQTPKSTLRYVGKIASYRANLETRFAEEVLAHYMQYEQQIVPVVN